MTAEPHTGSCQCGAVAFEADGRHLGAGDLQLLALPAPRLGLAFTPRESFTLLRGEDALTEYTFNRHVIRHQFCRTCGIQTFAYGKMPDGTRDGGDQLQLPRRRRSAGARRPARRRPRVLTRACMRRVWLALRHRLEAAGAGMRRAGARHADRRSRPRARRLRLALLAYPEFRRWADRRRRGRGARPRLLLRPRGAGGDAGGQPHRRRRSSPSTRSTWSTTVRGATLTGRIAERLGRVPPARPDAGAAPARLPRRGHAAGDLPGDRRGHGDRPARRAGRADPRALGALRLHEPAAGRGHAALGLADRRDPRDRLG